MSDVLDRPNNGPSSRGSELRRTIGKHPLRVLAVVDGTECAGRVTKYLLDMRAAEAAMEVVLLNVQPMPVDGRLRGYGSFMRDKIEDRLINDLGRKVVSSAGHHLDAASIAHKRRIELGHPAETIVRCAEEEHCDLIVLAEPKPGAVREIGRAHV